MRTAGGPPTGDAFFACPVCFEVFESDGERRPQLLDCGHSFCGGCIARWEETSADTDGSFSCPLCRRVSSVPEVHSPRGSSESLRNGMRVWIGPDGGVSHCSTANLQAPSPMLPVETPTYSGEGEHIDSVGNV